MFAKMHFPTFKSTSSGVCLFGQLLHSSPSTATAPYLPRPAPSSPFSSSICHTTATPRQQNKNIVQITLALSLSLSLSLSPLNSLLGRGQ